MKKIKIAFFTIVFLTLMFCSCAKEDDPSDVAKTEKNVIEHTHPEEETKEDENEVTEEEDLVAEDETADEEQKTEEEKSASETKQEEAAKPQGNEDTSSEKESTQKPQSEKKEEQTNVSVTPQTDNAGETYTGLPSLKPTEYTVTDPENKRGLSTAANAFSFGVAQNGSPHSVTVSNQKIFDNYNYNALAWDNKTSGKVLYLTFDCGYKYEDLTERILDTLKEKDVPAAFFCTLSYLKTDTTAVARMLSEGHIVGNHTATHPDCTKISREAFAKEILGVDNYMRVNYGVPTTYFRFPAGSYSESALKLVDDVNHRSVFWSVAYADWDPENQQGTETAFSQVTSRLHPGAVILLHSTSPDNVEILGRVIDYARNNGYEFRALDQYNYWK